MNESSGLAPEGWHVASDAEWDTLINYLGGKEVAGGKLKSTGTIEGGDGLWYSPNEGATNESGFTALPGGYRYNYPGTFYSLGCHGYWWSSTEYSSSGAVFRYLYYGGSYFYMYYGTKDGGFSVRCVRD